MVVLFPLFLKSYTIFLILFLLYHFTRKNQVSHHQKLSYPEEFTNFTLAT